MNNDVEIRVAEGRLKYYEATVKYLEKMHDLLKKTGRTQEFIPFIAELRATHARKKRFLEVMDSSGRKSIRHR
jgi:uncharacterized Zn finger protein